MEHDQQNTERANLIGLTFRWIRPGAKAWNYEVRDQYGLNAGIPEPPLVYLEAKGKVPAGVQYTMVVPTASLLSENWERLTEKEG